MKPASLLALMALLVALPCPRAGAADSVVVTDDGAWCWFSDPRALRLGNDISAGWMTADGSVQVGRLDVSTGATEIATLAAEFERDDHDHPALLALPDGRIAAFYANHGKGDLHLRTTLRPGEIAAWSPDRTLGFNDRSRGSRGVTYANPFLLRDEADALYLFWRGSDYKPTFSVSPDLGQTWAPPRTLVSAPGRTVDNRPYVKYWSDGRRRITFVFTDGHPRDEPANSLYYACYERGAFFRADGTRIGDLATLPLDPANCDRIYGGTAGRAWVWSHAQDRSGAPVVAYSRLPTEEDHRYHYARWDGRRWLDHEITPAGRWFPRTPPGTTEPEPHYSGGLALDPDDPTTVFLSRPVDGVFEIERWKTPDGGRTWTHTPVTEHSPADNVRPFVVSAGPAGSPTVMWMRTDGGYRHYTDFHTRLMVTSVESAGPVAPKPLYRDPVCDGAADPVVVWNPHVGRWWMFYTNRRANQPGLSGVAWVHGCRIGIAESTDGAVWTYLGTADIELPPALGGAEPTHWAPEIVTAPDGTHHLFLTVVPGVFEDWKHPRTIVHLTSPDLRHWDHAQPLALGSDRVIDACVHARPGGGWRMWYNNERAGKATWYADSPDLVTWTDRGPCPDVGTRPGEGPFVFRWKGRYWMLIDVWKGLAVFRSADLERWTPQMGDLLANPGRGRDDGVNGGHAGVVVSGDRAFLFYFTHPGRAGTIRPTDKDSLELRRSSIQVVELREKDGQLSCDRDTPTHVLLQP
jgi:hypothetical protein